MPDEKTKQKKALNSQDGRKEVRRSRQDSLVSEAGKQ